MDTLEFIEAQSHLVGYISRLDDVSESLHTFFSSSLSKLETLEVWEDQPKALIKIMRTGDNGERDEEVNGPLLLLKYYTDLVIDFGLHVEGVDIASDGHKSPSMKTKMSSTHSDLLKMLEDADLLPLVREAIITKIVALADDISNVQDKPICCCLITHSNNEKRNREENENGGTEDGTCDSEVKQDCDGKPTELTTHANSDVEKPNTDVRADLRGILQRAVGHSDVLLAAPSLPYYSHSGCQSKQAWWSWLMTSLHSYLVQPFVDWLFIQEEPVNTKPEVSLKEHPFLQFLQEHAQCFCKLSNRDSIPNSSVSIEASSSAIKLIKNMFRIIAQRLHAEMLIAKEHLRLLYQLQYRDSSQQAIHTIRQRYELDDAKLNLVMHLSKQELNGDRDAPIYFTVTSAVEDQPENKDQDSGSRYQW